MTLEPRPQAQLKRSAHWYRHGSMWPTLRHPSFTGVNPGGGGIDRGRRCFADGACRAEGRGGEEVCEGSEGDFGGVCEGTAGPHVGVAAAGDAGCLLSGCVAGVFGGGQGKPTGDLGCTGGEDRGDPTARAPDCAGMGSRGWQVVWYDAAAG